MYNDGEELFANFVNQRLLKQDKKFIDVIPRNIDKTMLVNKITNTKEKKTSTSEVKRNVLGKLLNITMNSEKRINFQEAFKYSLSPIPLSLSCVDGTKKKLRQI